MEPLLNQKAVVLFEIEATPGVDATPSEATDALLVADPQYSMEPTILERNFTRPDLSPYAHLVGRKLARISFSHEIRGNGLVDSGLLADAPKITRLMNACGYAVTAVPAGTGQIGAVVADADNPDGPVVSWAASGAPSAGALNFPVLYTIEVTTPGASGVAQISVTSSNPTEDANISGNTITSASPEALGTKGGTVTPTWTGNLVAGQKWHVLVTPPGVKVTPVSSAFKTATIYAYFDGLLHKLTGAVGSFSANCEAGNYGTMQFEFTGAYEPVSDAALPSNPTYESTLPPQVELANLTWGGKTDLASGAWTFEQANTVNPRTDVNSEDGYVGMRITGRTPTGTFTPEATLEADNAFWSDFAASKRKVFVARVGQTKGNMVVFYGPAVQTQSLAPGDRDGIRTYDVGMKFTRVSGNDEVAFIFC